MKYVVKYKRNKAIVNDLYDKRNKAIVNDLYDKSNKA